jgi:cytochrome c oxidase subunit 3
MEYQKYYVPEQSKFPIFAASSMFLLVMGAASTINSLGTDSNLGKYTLWLGLAAMSATLFFWFKKVTQEHLAGLDSAQLKKSFVFGMAWFIFSEVMFFAAFFWSPLLCQKLCCSVVRGRGRERCC